MGEIAYCFGITLVKLSILLFYRSIFNADKRFRLPLYIIATCCILWGVACTLVSIFSCTPIRGFWDLEIPAKCISTRNFFLGNAIPNITIDLAILCLPQYEIWKLQKMALKTKIVIACMFALGGLYVTLLSPPSFSHDALLTTFSVTLCSGLRLYYLLGMDLTDLTCESPASPSSSRLTDVPTRVLCERARLGMRRTPNCRRLCLLTDATTIVPICGWNGLTYGIFEQVALESRPNQAGCGGLADAAAIGAER